MTPKEKADELVNKYIELGKDFTRGVSMHEYSSECALVTCDEVLNALEENSWQNRLMMDYWEEVKQDIERL